MKKPQKLRPRSCKPTKFRAWSGGKMIFDREGFSKVDPLTKGGERYKNERFFTYMTNKYLPVVMDSDMEEIQRILFPPDYPYDIDAGLFSKMSDHTLIKLKSEISRELKRRKK